MQVPHVRLVALICTVVAIWLLPGCHEGQNARAATSQDSEITRVTSPDGELDAVVVREDGGGAPGGWEWYVFIVSKGSEVLPSSREVFQAGTLVGQKLVWTHENLLEIHYDIAYINHFRNVWALDEVEKAGSRGEHHYVEVKLAPASEFSILTPDGDFRRK